VNSGGARPGVAVDDQDAVAAVMMGVEVPSEHVLDSTIFYREAGAGVPIVFLHGNPTSSYLWRRILPAVGDPGWKLAPDLIGMGDSGKPDIEYTFADHARYLAAWFDTLGLDNVVLIGHDWGGALAFDWAARHPGRVRGVAFTETIVKPMTWQEFPEGGRELFRAIMTAEVGEAMLLDDNLFIEQVLPGSIDNGLSETDLDAYVVARIERYDEWLTHSADVPKLLLTFDPGAMLTPELIDWCVTNMADLEVEKCGAGGHHTPEDQPDAIAAAISAWLDRHGLR
jgi:haloalkane dehalogenase